MKKTATYLCLMGLFLLASGLKAQNTLFEEEVLQYGAGTVYNKTDEPASFPGGKTKMNDYFDLEFDTHVDQSKINDGAQEGFVEARFVVEADGKVKYVEITHNYTSAYDEEMIKTLQSMPKWKPAKKDGVAVRSYASYKYGVKFVNDGSIPSGGRKGHVVE